MVKGWGTRVAGVLLSAAMAVGLLAQPAVATTEPNGSLVRGTVAPRTDIPLADRKSWELVSTETGPVADGRRSHFAAYNSALEKSVAVKNIADVLGGSSPGVEGRPLCHATNAAGAEGFCWSTADDMDRTWVPQGLTGSGEAADNQEIVPGRRVVATSWSTTTYHPVGYNGMMRVTFADVTDLGDVTYWHALLVTATSGSSFTALKGHADSLTWYKNYLYLSTAAGLAVFDLRKIWLMTGTGTGVGMSGTTSSAAGYRYALPQVDRFEHRLPEPRACGSQNIDKSSGQHYPPCFAGISLDTSGAVPALVTTEVGEIPTAQQQSFNTVRTVTRWNLNPETGLLAWSPQWEDPSRIDEGVSRPAKLYTSTVSGAQGIAMNRGRFVISAACPGFIGNDAESEIVSCLYHAWPGEPVRLWTRVGVYAQNLSYWPGTDDLWTVNEKINTTSGERTVFNIPWPKAPLPLRPLVGLQGDLNGDAAPDLLAVRPDAAVGSGPGNGNLVLYGGVREDPAHGTQGGFGPRTSVGTDWNSIRLVSGVGDLARDPAGTPSYPDVLAVDNAGDLYLYKGVRGGFDARRKLSTGWGIVQKMTGVGDIIDDPTTAEDDGLPDLFAVMNDGEARLYPGRAGGLGPSKVVGTSWDTMRLVSGVGDLTGDEVPDVLAVDNAGDLFLYKGVKGGLDARVKLSTGWGTVQTMTGVGHLMGDGLPDLVAMWSDGTAHLYPGKSGGLGPKRTVDLGWAI